MGRSTVHYTDNETNNILKRLHNKLRPAGTPVQRVEYIIELLLLRIFEIKVRQDENFEPLRKIFAGDNDKYLFSYLQRLTGEQIKSHLNKEIFPFYARILTSARKVFKNNLQQKVQDNLILIEEVFRNSSFTTNVQSGNMSEIIGLISEIDENTILKTDILGDAIESALSETGGTQDIGLYRTPEHIRQMMVAITNPTFDDIIYDPACGTGGFLFDAYHYCIEKVTKDGEWPSPKCPPSHPELNEYFKKFFAKFNEEMPDKDKAIKFYRESVSGTEYLGMIRKMAAINLYIRGINPGNIIQGDSLHLFNPEIDSNSKTLILSNPPFGAERDQPAYPNVWKEYAKESETTILFVKLMFDLLKKGGRCAVVVSEGFLTWDKASARAMRKILLEEANLKAIISLPQGVFVSKQGQGAKTSILYFEKGSPTKWVWYYKIENDGFTMGVNRKPIDGCQIPEIIETFHKYVKYDKIPPEKKNSFLIPVEWIKTLDPRIKERIRKTTEEKIIIKRNQEKEKLEKKLQEKKSKGKITERDYRKKLKEFDLIIQSKIQNETSKEIEKAYLYSFNFQTYKSDLTDEQIKEWKEVLKDITPENKKDIDKKYEILKTADEDTVLKLLAGFNPQNSLVMDIAREVLNKFSQGNEKIKKLQEILQKGQRYPKVKLEKVLIPKYEKIKKDDYNSDYDIIEKIEFSKGMIYFREEKSTGMDLYKGASGDLITSKINLYQGALAIAPKELVCSTHYQVYQIKANEIEPKYLFYILRSKQFLQPIAEERSKGIKNEQGPEFLLNYKIPLPPLEIQREIIEKIEKQKSIIEGAEKILESWEVEVDILFAKYQKKRLGDYIEEVSEKNKSGMNIPVFLISKNKGMIRSETYFADRKIKKIYSDDLRNYKIIRKNQFAYSGIHANEGSIGYLDDYEIGLLSPIYRVFNIDLRYIIPKYLDVVLKSKYALDYYNKNTVGAIDRRVNLDFEYFCEYKIPLPPLEIQQKIVEELDREMEALEKVKLLKEKAEKRIEEILNEVWGEEKN